MAKFEQSMIYELGSNYNQGKFRMLYPALWTGSVYRQKKKVIQKQLNWLQCRICLTWTSNHLAAYEWLTLSCWDWLRLRYSLQKYTKWGSVCLYTKLGWSSRCKNSKYWGSFRLNLVLFNNLQHPKVK